MFKGRRALYLQLSAFVLAIGLLLLLSRFFPIVDLIAGAQKRVVDLGPWSALLFPLLFAVCNILLLPGGILSVGGGFFFGLWWGFVIVLVGNSIGAAISFSLSRWLGRRWFRRRLSGEPMLRILEPAVQREGWKIIFLSQLHPFFPTSLLNYLYGLTRIPFRVYMVWASIGRAPGLFVYVYLGTLGQFGLNVARGKTHPRTIEYWTWGGAFITTALLFILLSRTALRVVQDSRRHHSSDETSISIASPSRNITS
jgi:uncharacterized membrane protein YdjX (TVP38/TMEM64 family)